MLPNKPLESRHGEKRRAPQVSGGPIEKTAGRFISFDFPRLAMGPLDLRERI